MNTWKKKKLFLTVECQLTNVEKIIDVENHLVTIIVIINLIKKHQGMLELAEKNWLKNGIYTQPQSIYL